jgi:hypothetical protein
MRGCRRELFGDGAIASPFAKDVVAGKVSAARRKLRFDATKAITFWQCAENYFKVQGLAVSVVDHSLPAPRALKLDKDARAL